MNGCLNSDTLVALNEALDWKVEDALRHVMACGGCTNRSTGLSWSRVLGVDVGILLNHGRRLRGGAGEPIPGHAPFHRSQTYSSAHGVEPSQQRSRAKKRPAGPT